MMVAVQSKSMLNVANCCNIVHAHCRQWWTSDVFPLEFWHLHALPLQHHVGPLSSQAKAAGVACDSKARHLMVRFSVMTKVVWCMTQHFFDILMPPPPVASS